MLELRLVRLGRLTPLSGLLLLRPGLMEGSALMEWQLVRRVRGRLCLSGPLLGVGAADAAEELGRE